jgi:hypothetical protein
MEGLNQLIEMSMKSSRAIEILDRQRGLVDGLKQKSLSSGEFSKWHRDTEVAVQKIFGASGRHFTDFSSISYSLSAFSSYTPEAAFHQAYLRGLDEAKAVLSSMIDEIQEYEIDGTDISEAPNYLALVEKICLRFHNAARQLRNRHANRSTLQVEDEYDVQDLLHALLKIHFDDIRPEEWTPSYAGGSSRVDFLLKQEKIVIEVKKTRPSLK